METIQKVTEHLTDGELINLSDQVNLIHELCVYGAEKSAEDKTGGNRLDGLYFSHKLLKGCVDEMSKRNKKLKIKVPERIFKS
ncbi:MAG TPA: hypothetical protein VF181_02860 [Balneolaceae bacterium]